MNKLATFMRATYIGRALIPIGLILMVVGAFNLKIASYLTGLIFQKSFTRPEEKKE